MITWLYNILVGQFCGHKWKVIKEGTYVDTHHIRVGRYYDIQCDKCGNIKRKEL